MPDDNRLLSQLRERSPAAFQELFETYSDKLFRLAAGILKNDDDAEDIVQEVFIRFFETLDRFEGRSTIGTWLYRVAYNASIDRLRKDKSIPEAEFDDLEKLPLPQNLTAWPDTAHFAFEQQELQTQLNAAIQSLPDAMRMTFLLRDVEELSTHETAGILNISPGAVKVRLHRARLLMRESLSDLLVETEQRKYDNGMP